MSTDAMIGMFGIPPAPEQRVITYPGNDAWLEVEQAATTPGSDPAWLQLQGNMAGGPGADPAWVEIAR